MKQTATRRLPLLLLLPLTASLAFAAAAWAAPQTAAPGVQTFTVLHAAHLIGPSQAMSGTEANCVINGTGDAASMKCAPIGVTAQNAYNFNTALVVDPQGTAYVIACRIALVGNYWCKPFSSTRAVQGRIVDGMLSVPDGSKSHDYLVLATRSVGPVTTLQFSPPAKPSRSAPAAAAPPPGAAPAADSATCGASFTGACVSIVSDPPGADIYVDGKFMGNTPSMLALPVGSRQIRVEAPNRKPWTRTLEATSGSRVSLRATLDPAP